MLLSADHWNINGNDVHISLKEKEDMPLSYPFLYGVAWIVDVKAKIAF